MLVALRRDRRQDLRPGPDELPAAATSECPEPPDSIRFQICLQVGASPSCLQEVLCCGQWQPSRWQGPTGTCPRGAVASGPAAGYLSASLPGDYVVLIQKHLTDHAGCCRHLVEAVAWAPGHPILQKPLHEYLEAATAGAPLGVALHPALIRAHWWPSLSQLQPRPSS